MKHAYIVVLGAMLIAPHALADTTTGRQAFMERDFDTALKQLKPAAEQGDGEALYLLARMHQAGFGVPKNPENAASYFEKSAEADYADGQYAYAQILLLGEGIEQNLIEGVKWLFLAGQMNNHQPAMVQLKKLPMPREVILAARKNAFDWASARGKTLPLVEPAGTRRR